MGSLASDGGRLLYLRAADVELLLDAERPGHGGDAGAMLGALEAAFVAFSGGHASVPPRVAASTGAGLLAAMPGYVPGAGLGLKAIAIFPRNPEIGVPSHQGLIALFDESTGTPQCVMDAAAVTAARTAGGSAVATRLLARPGARVLAILGGGVQARSHLSIVGAVRPFAEIRVAARTPGHAEALATLDERAIISGSFEAAVRGADVVCCCTDAPDPVIRREWLRPGAHVTSVGTGRELDPATVEHGRVFVEWRGAAAHAYPAGARELQGMDPDRVTELGEVLLERRPGRSADDELTVYKSTGHAMEDLAAARLVYERALAQGVGQALAR